MGDWDWDLQAVVRGCSRGGGGGGVEAARDPFSSFPSSSMVIPEVDDGFDNFFFCFPNLLGTTAAEEEAENYSSVQELKQLYKPFFLPKSSPSPSPSSSHPPVQYPHQSPSSTSSAVSLLQTGDVVAARKQQQQRPVSAMARSKRRKNQQKKVVCHVPVDGLSSDMWAWRKYGQKPIKGSPYPRGYYRCSSSKGCLARKQVERSRTEPGVFVITYTAEHNHPMPTHRNSLAGSTRHKFPQSSPSCSTTTNNNNQVNSAGTGENLILSSTSSMSPTTTLTSSIDEELFLSVKKEGTEEHLEEEQQEDEDEGMLLVSDLEMLGEDDMLFFGLDDLHQPTSGDHFPTTATAGGS